MRSGAPADHTGYFHETAFYGSDEELVAIAAPFVEGGLAAGEPTLVALGARNADLLRRALGARDGLEFLPAGDQYARPARAIATYRELLAGYVARGAEQIRVIGDVPHPGTGAHWQPWLRYEAAVSTALEDFPLWGLCPYDLRITPPEVLADVERLHPHVVAADRSHRRSEQFADPASYVLDRLRDAAGVPASEVVHPMLVLDDVTSPGAVRRALRAVASEVRLDAARVDDLVMAGSEVVTNALLHGDPPVDVRAWADGGEVVVQVTDRGQGFIDPLIGLLAAPLGSEGGYGLWVAHQVCDRVDLDLREDGFAVRLVMAAPSS